MIMLKLDYLKLNIVTQVWFYISKISKVRDGFIMSQSWTGT